MKEYPVKKIFTTFTPEKLITMKKLLSLPPRLAATFHEITGLDSHSFFCGHDPVDHKLGSGGGTAWLLWQAFLADGEGHDFASWLSAEQRIVLHAGGQSRRLPAYAPSGKILTPIPVFRWERGQRIGQTLLDLQLPLYERLMAMAPAGIHTMVVSGDVLVRATQPLPPVPAADVVCYGLWLPASVATNHGVFVSSRRNPGVLKMMLQKPAVQTLGELQREHLYLTDIGVWMLSDRAVELLMRRCRGEGTAMREYDLYGEFGCALGSHPTMDDDELRRLSVAVVPLTGGEFYHFGTSRELISSALAVQHSVRDQRQIMHHDHKPQPSIFVQNAITRIALTEENTNVWIENSYIGEHWKLRRDNIVTGVPRNDWHLTLQPGECIDVVPVDEAAYCIRRYHIDDRFAGEEQRRRRFPRVESIERLQQGEPPTKADGGEYLSAEDLSARADLRRLFRQRQTFLLENLPAMARNWKHSVFYQLDLGDAAERLRSGGVELPPPLPEEAPLLTRMHDAMFRGDSEQAFRLLREGMVQAGGSAAEVPHRSVCDDQIVWGRSPVRIDIAGGWTDTPPYCLMEGGSVINLAIELNGQPPIQCYVKPCREPKIVVRSIDLGASEEITTSGQLAEYNKVGSPFSIPKAALVLAGFGSGAAWPSDSLRDQLELFGSGIELTLLSAIPAGSGLGTSSILAATVLGALSDFCSLGWDKTEIGRRTLMLEQLLTTGGGWQDQFGGAVGGVKLLQTPPGFEQSPVVRWLPDDLWTLPEYQPCHLLYYTGITRTAKHILEEIVRRMFLNHHDQLLLLRQMKEHTLEMYDAIERRRFALTGALVGRSWTQNQLLDSGTNPPEVAALTSAVDDFCLGYKLPGAGGGGFLYMVAKDPEAAARIKTILNENRRNANARFVEMTLSKKGLQVSRS